MPEPQKTTRNSPGITPAGPTRFFAWGRMAMGIVISVAGAAGLHVLNEADLAAFAIVASVSGFILSAWAFVGTLVSPKASREDCLWATMFMALVLLLVAGNLYFNRLDYGLFFVGAELIIGAGCLLAGIVVAFAYRWLVRRKSYPRHTMRGRMLIAFALTLACLWVPVRWPVLALYHCGYFGGEEYYPFDEAQAAQATLRSMPNLLVRWAVSRSRGNRVLFARAETIGAVRDGLDIRWLKEVALTDGLVIDQLSAIKLLCQREPAAGRSVAVSLLKSGKYSSDNERGALVYMLVERQCSREEYDSVLDALDLARAVGIAYFFGRTDLLLHAVRRRSFEAVAKVIAENYEITGDDFALTMFTGLDADARIQLFGVWKANDGQKIAGWQRLSATAQLIYARAFGDPDLRVVRAALKNYLSILQRPEELPFRLDALNDVDDLRKACKSLISEK